MSNTLIFCFDGTWNGRDDEIPTNVLKMHRGLRVHGQISFYHAGPGNEDENNLFQELLGGLFGWGSNEIRDMALTTLGSVYRPGDRIVAIGFSRGAAIARLFCAKVYEEGVNGHRPAVDFLGCFDTVGAYLPIGPSQQGLFHDLHVSAAVKIACHAVALDEDRATFEPNLMNQRDGVLEVWFPGVHTDIGGGSKDTGLSDGPLQWMLEWMAKCNITSDVPTSPDAAAPLGDNSGLYRRKPRRVGVKVDDEWSDDKALLHPSVGG